jgi:hypothetical protein
MLKVGLYARVSTHDQQTLEAMYAGIEAKTRRLLATLSQGDLEAVIRFFHTLSGARASTPIDPKGRSRRTQR